MEKSLRAAVKSKTPKGYLEAIHEHHGPCPDRVKDDYYIRKSIRLHGGTEMYGKTEYTPENKRELSQNEPTRIIENTIKKSENDKKELSVDYDNLIIVIKAYVCGVLVENTTDWMILSNEYNTLFEIIDKHISKQKPVETLKYAESFMDIYIPHEEYKKISQLSKLDKPNIQQLTEIEQKLEQQILLN